MRWFSSCGSKKQTATTATARYSSLDSDARPLCSKSWVRTVLSTVRRELVVTERETDA